MNINSVLETVIQRGFAEQSEISNIEKEIENQQLRFLSERVFQKEALLKSKNVNEIQQIRNFFELSTSFFYLVQNFKKGNEFFSLLSYFYNNFEQILPVSALHSKVISFRLIFLFSTQKLQEFYSLYGSVPESIRSSADFKNLDEFVFYMEIGNFVNAIKALSMISPAHQNIIYEIKRNHLVEFFNKNLQNA